jgi:hypothetical protein
LPLWTILYDPPLAVIIDNVIFRCLSKRMMQRWKSTAEDLVGVKALICTLSLVPIIVEVWE